MKNFKLARGIIPLIAVCLPFFVLAFLTFNYALLFLAAAVTVCAVYVYAKRLHNVDFDADSREQKQIFAFTAAVLVLFSFLVCAISIEDEWMYDYPLKKSVDNYGCYPQMFDAFQKGQLNIDTEYDLAVFEKLENPYDPVERYKATGEKQGVFWDRAYYDGKLYSYFGIAPIVFLYYPIYFITGSIPSDALAAAVITAISACFMLGIMYEFFRRTERKVPFLLVLLGGIASTCGALLWSSQTCANFYHIAVLSGICSVCAFFYNVMRAQALPDGIKRKLIFAFSGICVAAIAASRPNMVLYVFIALPMLISVIRKREYGVKSLWLDITAFCLPMILLGSLLMLYNYSRFGSPFDFGSAYQLTLADTATYSFSGMLVSPAIYHYFLQPPSFNGTFPYIHPIAQKMANYGVDRAVYVARSIGALYIPCTWGMGIVATLKRDRLKFITALTAVAAVVLMAIFDFCFGGVHLRYLADIMFVVSLIGIYALIYAVGAADRSNWRYVALYTIVVCILLGTVFVEIPLMFDNERIMIYRFHREIYTLIRGY